MDAQRQKSAVAALSVTSNTALVLFKTVVGLATGSVSVLSEAIHSAMDLVAALIALFAVRRSAKPADDEHPFGHAKVESISAAVEALLIAIAAAWIVYEAVQRLLTPQPIEMLGWGVSVMLCSSLLNLVVSEMLFKVGKRTESAALLADGWHLRTDVYTSVGVMVGLSVIFVGQRLLPGVGLQWVDPVAAILVAVLILQAAYRLTANAVSDMMDTSFSSREKDWIGEYLSGLFPTILSFHRVRTRKAGAARFVDMHLVVDPGMSTKESHDITDRISEGIERRFVGADVIVHVEPCDGACDPECAGGCLLTGEERRAKRAAAQHQARGR